MSSGSGNFLSVEMFQLLESPDTDTAQNIRDVILENLSSKETWLIPLLVDYYFKTESSNVKEILSLMGESHAKVLIEKLQDGVKAQDTRLPALQLVLYLVYKELPWCHQLLEMSFFSSILKCLKNDQDVPVLMTSLMVVVILLPSAPVSMGRLLPQIFDVFGRLTLFCVRKPANTPEVLLLHLQVGLYSLFNRLYGMFPRSLLEFIGKFFSFKENLMAYQEIVLPMLERVRLHPNIIMGQGQSEMDTNRWRNQETQDIIVSCSKLSLDLIEGSLEEAQCPIYQSFHQVTTRCRIDKDLEENKGPNTDPIPIPVSMATDSHSDSRFLMPWTEDTVIVGESPSVLIGLSTPPSSQRTTPAASFLEPNANGGTWGATPDSASRQATPCCGGGGDAEERTPLSSNRSSVSQNLSKLSDSGKKPTLVTPKAVPSVVTPNTTPVNMLHCPGGPFSSPGISLSAAEASPLKVQSSAFMSPKHTRSPAMRSIEFGSSQGKEDSSKAKEDRHEVTMNLEKKLNSLELQSAKDPGNLDQKQQNSTLGDPDDKEVEEINERGDQFNTEGSPTSSISTQTSQTEVTAESVRQFMKKVNRIRFNSLTSNSSSEHDAHMTIARGIQQRSRPRSCPPLKRIGPRWYVEKAWVLKEGCMHAKQSAAVRSRKSWMKSGKWEEDAALEEENDDGQKTEEVSEESSEDISSASGTIPQISIVRSSRGRSHSKSKPLKPTLNASTQVDPVFPAEINPAFQLLFAPSKISICNKCQHEMVLTSSQSTISNINKDGKTTTIKSTEVTLFNALSPPELLDRHLKLGSELHAKELNKIPLTSKDSVNWTHFGGVPPADEVAILKNQIILMQAQLMYERHKRSNHAKRNRRLLRRITHEAKLEEQQKTLSEQIRLLEQEVQQLSVSIKLVQEDNRKLRLGQESDEYSKLVQFRSSLQENKDLKASSIELKNLLLTQKEDYDKLQKKLEHVEHMNLEYEKELQRCKEQLDNTEKLKGQVFKLQKEVLLMQELHQKYQEKLHHQFPSQPQKNEQALLVASLKSQLEEVQKEHRKKTTLLEAYQASACDNENEIKKMEAVVAKLKHELSKSRISHSEQIKALEDRINGLIHTNHQLESRVVEIICKVDQQQHKQMLEEIKKTEASGRRQQGSNQQGLENPAKLDNMDSPLQKTNNSPAAILTSDTRSPMQTLSSASGVSVILAKEAVSAQGSTFFNEKDVGFMPARNPALSLRSRAETDVLSDSGAASRSSFRVDSDVSMRSVSEDSLMTTDSGCWPKT